VRSGGVLGCFVLAANKSSVAAATGGFPGNLAVGVGILVRARVNGFGDKLGVPAERASAQYGDEQSKRQRKT
jgi:hypothetical protein